MNVGERGAHRPSRPTIKKPSEEASSSSPSPRAELLFQMIKEDSLATCPELCPFQHNPLLLDADATVLCIRKTSHTLIAALSNSPAPDFSPIIWMGKIRLPNGQIITVCILVDTGAHGNFMSDAFKKRLGCKSSALPEGSAA